MSPAGVRENHSRGELDSKNQSSNDGNPAPLRLRHPDQSCLTAPTIERHRVVAFEKFSNRFLDASEMKIMNQDQSTVAHFLPEKIQAVNRPLVQVNIEIYKGTIDSLNFLWEKMSDRGLILI